ncbi:aspartate/glutamate racemase family protein [Marinomonas spartinae]|uniref:aspartate/glutamate racemase family protein n=1 Tax=Marinomonas spartinae TaxID=1792290 RepID=UPI0008307C7B|nr:aspartate/glutamate racemase family protein [Marinomonas spartinae]
MATQPRIALIHALEESIAPAREIFAQEWPEAFCFDLLDTSLAIDLAEAGTLDDNMMQRFSDLADYAARTTGKADKTDAILFTCSAFGPAIDAVKGQLSIPVLRPNESAFAEAIAMGSRIGLMVTFGPSLPALKAELEAMAAEQGKAISIYPILVEGALAALKNGDANTHNRLVAEACSQLPDIDVLVLGQFSLAKAAPSLREQLTLPVLTTPQSAVNALRARTYPIIR